MATQLLNRTLLKTVLLPVRGRYTQAAKQQYNRYRNSNDQYQRDDYDYQQHDRNNYRQHDRNNYRQHDRNNYQQNDRNNYQKYDRNNYRQHNRNDYQQRAGPVASNRKGKFLYDHMSAGNEQYDPNFDRYNSRHDNVVRYMYPPREQVMPYRDVDDDLRDLEEAAAIEDRSKEEQDRRGSLPFVINQQTKYEILNRVMCPYQHVIYENQLRRKYNNVRMVLKDLGHKLKRTSPVVVDGLGLPCPLDLVKRAPKVIEYRNKDEFSIWPGVDGNRKTVGFFVGEPSKFKNVVAVEPDQLIITKPSHRKLANLFQTYLRDHSPYDVCTNFSNPDGHWRRFIVRSNEQGDHMVVCQMHPQNLSDEQIQEEKDRLTNYWRQYETEMSIKSAYLQPCPGTRMSADEAPYLLLFGDPTITETINDKKFIISPESFFQVNTQGAEVLYNTIFQEVAPDPTFTLIDLCCGTGTISTLLAPFCRRVIGIEQSAQAIEDAKRNAAANNVRNISFICGRAEDEIVKMLDEFRSEHIVLVANPSRAGLRPSVISAIREMQQIEKVVYISCKPDGPALKNFVHLSLKENPKADMIKGSPFVPVNAIPVDLFPQTSHIELVLTFERFAL